MLLKEREINLLIKEMREDLIIIKLSKLEAFFTITKTEYILETDLCKFVQEMQNERMPKIGAEALLQRMDTNFDG